MGLTRLSNRGWLAHPNRPRRVRSLSDRPMAPPRDMDQRDTFPKRTRNNSRRLRRRSTISTFETSKRTALGATSPMIPNPARTQKNVVYFRTPRKWWFRSAGMATGRTSSASAAGRSLNCQKWPSTRREWTRCWPDTASSVNTLPTKMTLITSTTEEQLFPAKKPDVSNSLFDQQRHTQTTHSPTRKITTNNNNRSDKDVFSSTAQMYHRKNRTNRFDEFRKTFAKKNCTFYYSPRFDEFRHFRGAKPKSGRFNFVRQFCSVFHRCFFWFGSLNIVRREAKLIEKISPRNVSFDEMFTVQFRLDSTNFPFSNVSTNFDRTLFRFRAWQFSISEHKLGV